MVTVVWAVSVMAAANINPWMHFYFTLLPEGLLEMSQIGFHCVHWMDGTPYEVFHATFQYKNMTVIDQLLFTIGFYGKFNNLFFC